MSEEYEKFHEIPPFKVKADPSILINDEDYPWLRRNKQTTQAKKKWRVSLATIMMIPCQLCNRRVWYHCPFCTCTCYANFFRVHLKTMNFKTSPTEGRSHRFINKATKKTKKEFPNLKTNGTNRKFIIFLKLKAKRIKK